MRERGGLRGVPGHTEGTRLTPWGPKGAEAVGWRGRCGVSRASAYLWPVKDRAGPVNSKAAWGAGGGAEAPEAGGESGAEGGGAGTPGRDVSALRVGQGTVVPEDRGPRSTPAPTRDSGPQPPAQLGGWEAAQPSETLLFPP